MKNQKALVLFSGGLDSRLTVLLLKKQGFKPELIYFKLPFNKPINPKFKDFKLYIIDCTKSPLLEKYLSIIKKPKFGTGAGINPCIDCRLFILKQAKQFAKKIKADLIATGDVLNQRPMSQTKKALEIIDKEINFKITRPLIDLEIRGKSRKPQIQLAKKFKISYPTPAGGCLLCEKQLVKRFKLLLEKNLITEKTLQLTKLGRHFFINKNWFIVGRNKEENKIIEKHKNSISSAKKTPAVYFHNKTKQSKQKAIQLQKAYQNKKPEEFEKFKV